MFIFLTSEKEKKKKLVTEVYKTKKKTKKNE